MVEMSTFHPRESHETTEIEGSAALRELGPNLRESWAPFGAKEHPVTQTNLRKRLIRVLLVKELIRQSDGCGEVFRPARMLVVSLRRSCSSDSLPASKMPTC
jgi:hypothetical protein